MREDNLFLSASPGLYSSLKRVLLEQELAEFSRVFSLVVALGASDEGKVHRKEGASYNPRPSRIVTIIAGDRTACNIKIFLTALWSCVQEISEDVPREFRDTVGRIRTGLDEPGKIQSVDEATVALALTLDQIRHLHMEQRSEIEKKTVLLRAETLRQQLQELVGENHLIDKLAYSTEQQSRMLQMVSE